MFYVKIFKDDILVKVNINGMGVSSGGITFLTASGSTIATITTPTVCRVSVFATCGAKIL